MSGEKLSQEQIDALLKAVNEGEEMPAFAQEAGKQEKFQEYDFNRPRSSVLSIYVVCKRLLLRLESRRHRRYQRVCVFQLN